MLALLRSEAAHKIQNRSGFLVDVFQAYCRLPAHAQGNALEYGAGVIQYVLPPGNEQVPDIVTKEEESGLHRTEEEVIFDGRFGRFAIPIKPIEYVLHDFHGDDLALRNSRVELTESIARLMRSGLSEHTADAINSLAAAHNNAALNYHIRASHLDQHLAEVESIYSYLKDQLRRSSPAEERGQIAFALDEMKTNIFGQIRRRATT
jgi:hypothetical protein